MEKKYFIEKNTHDLCARNVKNWKEQRNTKWIKTVHYDAPLWWSSPEGAEKNEVQIEQMLPVIIYHFFWRTKRSLGVSVQHHLVSIPAVRIVNCYPLTRRKNDSHDFLDFLWFTFRRHAVMRIAGGLCTGFLPAIRPRNYPSDIPGMEYSSTEKSVGRRNQWI